MKNKVLFITILVGFIFCISLFMSQPSFAFNLYGWWKSEGKNPHRPDLLLINKYVFSGFPYKIIKENGSEIQISLNNYSQPTIIQINGEDRIVITTVKDIVMPYKRITDNVSITRKEVEKLIAK